LGIKLSPQIFVICLLSFFSSHEKSYDPGLQTSKCSIFYAQLFDSPPQNMKYQLNTKMVVSLIATTLIVSGLAYAATTITNTSQTVVNNDIMSADWFNDVNSKLSNLGNKMTTVETKLSNVSTAQNRITGSCPTGKAIQSIDADGTVTCVSVGSALGSGTFYGSWSRYANWETLDDTVSISCHKTVATILASDTYDSCPQTPDSPSGNGG
jgi:hypothetical protein